MNDKALFLKAGIEFDSEERDKALWSKSLTLSNGDQLKAKYLYISLRVEELKKFQTSDEKVTKAAPKVETKAAPKVETKAAPKVETKAAPKVESIKDPMKEPEVRPKEKIKQKSINQKWKENVELEEGAQANKYIFKIFATIAALFLVPLIIRFLFGENDISLSLAVGGAVGAIYTIWKK